MTRIIQVNADNAVLVETQDFASPINEIQIHFWRGAIAFFLSCFAPRANILCSLALFRSLK